MKTGLHRGAIGLLALALVGLLVLYFRQVRGSTRVGDAIHELVASEAVLLVPDWTPTFFRCEVPAFSKADCVVVDSGDGGALRFPLTSEALAAHREKLAGTTHVELLHRLSDEEKAWIDARLASRYFAPYVVWPQTYQNFFEPAAGLDGPGLLDLVFPAPSARVEDSLQVVLDVRGLGWFGPTDFSPALVQNNKLENYLSLQRLVLFGWDLGNLLAFSLPVIFLGFYLLVGQNPVFGALLFLSSGRAAFMYLSHSLERQGALAELLGLEFSSRALFSIDGLVLALLVNFSWAAVFRRQMRAFAFWSLALAGAVAFHGASLMWDTPTDFLLVSNLWRDLAGASGAVIVLAGGFVAALARKRHFRTLLETIEDDAGSASFFARVAIFILAFILLLLANLQALSRNANEVEGLLWGDALFLPLLALGALVAVAAMNARGIAYSQTMKKRAQELLEAIKNLPRHRTPAEATSFVERSCIQALPDLGKVVAGTGEGDTCAITPVWSTHLFEEDSQFLATLGDALAVNLTNIRVLEDLRQAHAAASRFVPQEFLRELGCCNLVDLRFGMNRACNMAVLFCDIRGFTTLSEELEPGEVFHLLNQHFSQIVPVVQECGGFVDKFIGDAVMALFPRSPLDAVRCAAQFQRVARLSRPRSAQSLEIGVGVHWGHVTLGTVGSDERMETTVVADAVNVASRLESVTKEYKVQVVVSGEVIDALSETERHALGVRFLDEVILRGRQLPTTIYDLFEGEDEEQRRVKRATRADFEQGTRALGNGRWAEAENSFDRVLAVHPDDKAAAALREACLRKGK